MKLTGKKKACLNVSCHALALGVFLIFVLLGGCTTNKTKLNGDSPPTARMSFNVPELLTCYQQNNQNTPPIVSYMIDGTAMFLIYPDGIILTSIETTNRNQSGLLVAQLPAEELADVLAKISSMNGFWSLSNRYTLSRWSEQATHHVNVRIPNRPKKEVSVYGRLNGARSGDSNAPPEFKAFIVNLLSIHPKSSIPWNPGYVELSFADYSYASETSLPWPSLWPSLKSPLVRDVKGWIIQKIMIFPSQSLPELDAFLAKRPERGAILISNWKASVGYRWPLPAEKSWSTWDQ